MQNRPYEEDSERIFNSMLEIMGPVGAYIYPATKKTALGVAVESPKYGKMWYGDVDMDRWSSEFYPKLMKLDETAGWMLVASN